jgi:hypothetical protein
MKSCTPTTLLTLSLAAALCSVASAATLVYEGFNYSLSNGDSINGVTSTATGLTGAWAVANNIGTGTGMTASSSYLSTGLSFAGYQSTAGALQVSATGGGNPSTATSTTAGIQYNGATVNSGTLFTGFLFNVNSASATPAAQSSLRFGTTIAGGTLTFVTATESNRADTVGSFGGSYTGATSNAGAGITLPSNTTLFAITSWSNIASGSSNGTLKIRVLDETKYASWILAGGTEAHLDVGANVVGTHTINNAATGAISLTSGLFLQFLASTGSNGANTETVTYDEIRWGTSIGDIAMAPIPEPSAFAALVGLGALGIVGMSRRRR